MKEFKERFIAEALELLSKLEKSLLLLEEQPKNDELIEEIFRGLHTLKGSSGMYGFEKIGHLMHLIESVFEKVRDKKQIADNQIINLSLSVVDFTSRVFKLNEDVSVSTLDDYTKLITRIEEITGKQEAKTDKNSVEERKKKATISTYYIAFTIDVNFERRGVKLDAIFNELNGLGNIISIPIEEKNKNSTKWEIFIVSDCSVTDLEDLFIFMIDIVQLEKLGDENLFFNNEFNSTIQKNSALKQTNNLIELKRIIQQSKQKNDQNQTKSKQPVAETAQVVGTNFLRVAADKLDEQMDLLSELVTAKAELRLIVDNEKYTKLYKLVEAFDKVTNSFRKNILNVRLVQVKIWYVMFLRLVRDISKQLNKQVEFLAEGLETEIDKNIIDSLEGPLNHLIRNSLDHGLETTEERIAAGKSPKGTIILKASHSGSRIIIAIKDDGRGLDKQKIRRKAISKGLIEHDAVLTDKQLFDLVFLPGFTTAENISEVSGRGVGMDIVKKTINQLRGEIEIISEEGKGTDVVIKLPMMLSIIDTLLIRSGAQYFAIPLSDVNKCTQLTTKQLQSTDNQHIVVEGELIPYINLRKLFGIKGEMPEKQKIIIVTSSGKNIGLLTDEVIGEYQAVLKPFDGYYIDKQYFIGASLLADGQLCVILDTSKLLSEELKINN